MNDKMLIVSACIGALLASNSPVYGHTQAETNALIRLMLGKSIVRARYDATEDSLKAGPRYESSQALFFQGDDEWSDSDRRGAFDWYLRNLSSTARSYGPVSGRIWTENPLACAALAQCEIMNYTNAVEIMYSNAQGGFDQSRELSIDLAIRWSDMGDSLAGFVNEIVTNGFFYSQEERNRAYRTFCVRLMDLSSRTNGDEIANCIDSMYLRRNDPAGAVIVDRLLVECRVGYSNSVERCENASRVLDNTNLTQNCRAYFTAVTNSLCNHR